MFFLNFGPFRYIFRPQTQHLMPVASDELEILGRFYITKYSPQNNFCLWYWRCRGPENIHGKSPFDWYFSFMELGDIPFNIYSLVSISK